MTVVNNKYVIGKNKLTLQALGSFGFTFLKYNKPIIDNAFDKNVGNTDIFISK